MYERHQSAAQINVIQLLRTSFDMSVLVLYNKELYAPDLMTVTAVLNDMKCYTDIVGES